MYISLIGPAGVGKGTQSEILESNLGYYHFDVGRMLRAKSDGNVDKQINNGSLVSNDFISELLYQSKLDLLDKVVFDGIPRSKEQAIILQDFFNNIKKNLHLVIELDLNFISLRDRISNRFICSKCNETYNTTYKIFKGICTNCKSINSIIRRADDNLETFKVRQELYEKNISDIREFYISLGIYRKIEINDDVQSSAAIIFNVIKENR